MSKQKYKATVWLPKAHPTIEAKDINEAEELSVFRCQIRF